MSRQLTVDLGFNFDTQPIGVPLGKDPDEAYYPLQMGINDGDQAVWSYALRPGDQIRFKVTDVTHSASATPDDVAESPTHTSSSPDRKPTAVFVAFVNPDTSEPGSQFWPFTTQPSGVYRSKIAVGAQEPGLAFDTAATLVWESDDDNSSVYCQDSPDWAVNRWHCKLSESDVYLTLRDTPCFVKCSFLVHVTGGDGTTKRFIQDPEWFVGGGTGG